MSEIIDLSNFRPLLPCRHSSFCTAFQGLGIFSQLLPKGLEGSVLFLHDVGNAPTSGNALINYGLPQEFKDEIGFCHILSVVLRLP